jgi:hypothetical protein
MFLMNTDSVLSVVFFLTDSGREPVREWLKSLDKEDRKPIVQDLELARRQKNLWLSG